MTATTTAVVYFNSAIQRIDFFEKNIYGLDDYDDINENDDDDDDDNKTSSAETTLAILDDRDITRIILSQNALRLGTGRSLSQEEACHRRQFLDDRDNVWFDSILSYFNYV